MITKTTLRAIAGLALLAAATAYGKAAPPVIGLGAPPPAGAVVLFDGKSTAAWNKAWEVKGGAMAVKGGTIASKEHFADALVHVEFRTPNMPEAKGQAKGNSGVFLLGNYEVQVLDSYGIANPGKGDCGAIYNIAAPLVNACLPPMQWQSYDIIFRAPRYNAEGKKTENARLTVFQNGRLIQNNVEAPHNTSSGPSGPESATGPLVLQDHGDPVSYRNIWVLPLPASGADKY